MASTVATSNDRRFAELSAKLDNVLKEVKSKDDKIEALLSEIKAKDARIRRLEATLKLTPQERLNTVKEHGTIKDLVDKIHSLESELTRKDREVAMIREIYVPKKLETKLPSPTHQTGLIPDTMTPILQTPISPNRTSRKQARRRKPSKPTVKKRLSPNTTPECTLASPADILISSGDEPMMNASGYISDI